MFSIIVPPPEVYLHTNNYLYVELQSLRKKITMLHHNVHSLMIRARACNSIHHDRKLSVLYHYNDVKSCCSRKLYFVSAQEIFSRI